MSDNDEIGTVDDYEETIHRSRLIENSLFSPVANQPLGEWEKHTKGFGSKMLQKYGYIVGTGLGQNGEGIIVPISAQIFPPGRSLDHCMVLREQANGDKNLFSVERKLKQQKKKQEIANEKGYAREDKLKSDIFSFINENVFSKKTAELLSSNGTPSTEKPNLRDHSAKNLNVASLKIHEEVRKVEKEIQRLRESMARQKTGSPIYSKLKIQLDEKNGVLAALRKSEKNVATEQTFRKDKNKLTIF